MSKIYHIKPFQSTLPREERLLLYAFCYILRNFNPRSHERIDVSSAYRIKYKVHFNPRSHERSDVNSGSKSSINNISIHAPTRGATEKLEEFESAEIISIHAPTRGATRYMTLHVLKHGFQSTLPREERRYS